MNKTTGIYSRVYKKLYKIFPNLNEIKEYKKLQADNYMDLHLDILHSSEDEIRIALAHNYTENGDTIASPDMEIRIYPKLEIAEALTYQDTFGYRVVYPEKGKFYPKAKKELNSFLNKWLSNIIQQGHQ